MAEREDTPEQEKSEGLGDEVVAWRRERSVLYVLPNCGHCERARRLLTESGEPFNEIMLSDPLSQIGCLTVIGTVSAPLLFRPDGLVYILSEAGVEGWVSLKRAPVKKDN